MIIAGAGSAGKEALAVLLLKNTPQQDIVFFDTGSKAPDRIWDKYPVLKTDEAVKACLIQNPFFCVAIGQSRLRERLFNRLLALGGVPASIIAPNAFSISPLPENGTIVQPGAVISYDVTIGTSCIIHANATIGHKVTIGDFVNISPLVSIVGPCHIGPHCFIGSGSVILPHLKIGKHVLIPAGSIVSRDLKDYETYETPF